MKKLILYAYFEKPGSKNNLEFFFKNGYIDNSNYQFVVVINGNICSANIPKKNNIKVLSRENDAYDFGAWGHALNNIQFHEYDYFVFINSTCIGPFIPRYTPKNINWVDLFISRLDEVYKLCGPTINYLPKDKNRSQHIQSFAFATDSMGLDLLKRNGIFDPKEKIERKDLIENHELGMSDVLLSNNYKLYPFQLSENINSKVSDKSNLHGDIHYVGKYYDDTINPIEVMFIKTNRINNKTLNNYINFSS